MKEINAPEFGFLVNFAQGYAQIAKAIFIFLLVLLFLYSIYYLTINF